MAKSTTTHVIEIETGIGEPAFIPLSMGQELQPISVGKKGMWRIESPRVLDVHAFVYFDGNALFLQSADESNAASVDGFRVGKAWTELHAPCMIDVGMARLRYRSLFAPDNEATELAVAPPVPAPPGGPGPVRAPPSAEAANVPLSFPKAERPFKLGELSTGPDAGESTRIKPLDATGQGRIVSAPPPIAILQVQGPMAAPPPLSAPPPQPLFDPGPPPPQFAPPPGPPRISMAPPGYASMPPQAAPRPAPAGGAQDLVARLKRPPVPQVAAGVIFLLVLMVGGLVFLSRDKSRQPTSTLDGGAPLPSAGGAPLPASPPLQAAAPPMWPAGVPCPPPNWPPELPPPCTPNPATPPPPIAPLPIAAGGAKTLERQALDLLIAGDRPRAASIYEDLARRDPQNRVYAEAARILRAKIDAGAP